MNACWTSPKRFGDGCAFQLQTPDVGSQLHVFAGLLSGSEPSIMRSIEPELSSRMRTFGSGGFVSTCWARAVPPAKRPSESTPADAAETRIFMLAFLLIVGIAPAPP